MIISVRLYDGKTVTTTTHSFSDDLKSQEAAFNLLTRLKTEFLKLEECQYLPELEKAKLSLYNRKAKTTQFGYNHNAQEKKVREAKSNRDLFINRFALDILGAPYLKIEITH